MEKAAKHLAEDPSVDFVEQNARFYPSDVTWGLDRVDDRNLPLDGSFTPSGDGENVVAYIIDTGVQVDHQEYTGRIRWGTNTIDEDNSDVGFDCRTDRFDFLYFFHFTLNKLSFKVNWRSGGIEDKFIPKAKTYC